jgi:hypothetical protein
LPPSNKRPCCRIVLHSNDDNDHREVPRRLAPSPDCIMMCNDNDAWWLLPRRRNTIPPRNTTTHELQCRFCQVALTVANGSLTQQQQYNQHYSLDQQQEHSTQRPSTTLLDFYRVQEAAGDAPSGGRTQYKNTSTSSTSSRSMVMMTMPGYFGGTTAIQRHAELLQQSANQCSYCDRTDQCRNCTVRCDHCVLVFCSFCRTYDAQGAVVCLVCRSDLNNSCCDNIDDTVPTPQSSRDEEGDTMEMG